MKRVFVAKGEWNKMMRVEIPIDKKGLLYNFIKNSVFASQL